MIKITEGWMVNMLQQLDYQGADEQEEEEARAGGVASKVTDSKVSTVPHRCQLPPQSWVWSLFTVTKSSSWGG